MNKLIKGLLVGVALMPALIFAQTALTVDITTPANNAEVVVGQGLNFTGTVSGGTAPYTYRWTFSDGTEVAGQNISKTFGTTGSVTVAFRATDINLNTATETINLTVVEADDNDPALAVSNVRVTDVTSSSAIVRWTTNKPATSRVIYDTVSHSSIEGASAPNYGYANSTSTSNEDPMVTEHAVTVTGLSSNTQYFFRVISTR